MEVDLQSLREIAATNYIRAVEEAYGENGLQALRRLTPALDLIHEQLAYEMIAGGLTVACPLEATNVLRPDLQGSKLSIDQLAGRVDGAAVLQLLADGSVGTLPLDTTPSSLSDSAVVYHFDGADHFVVGGELIDVPNPTTFPSIWGIPTFFDLGQALEHYRDALALRCRCPELQAMWFDPESRWILQNKPEDQMQLSLHVFLVSSLRAHQRIEVRREQPAGGRRPPDIKVTWSMTNRLAFVEVKWMGASVHATEHRISWRPDEREANKGASQLVKYLDENAAEAPGYQTMGFLVVFDARREGVDVDAELTREQAVHFVDRDVVYDPDYTEQRHDFAEPLRMYIYPSAPSA